ncbi:MAG TPA: universal stress protein [Solirubrobacterales bacterium]|jgi:nucleotide-binding universal stress UspA family protein
MESILIGYERTLQGEDALALGGIFSEVLSAGPMIVTALPFSSTAMGRSNMELSLSVDTAEMLSVARDRLAPLEPASAAIASPSAAKGLAESALARGASMIVIGSSHRGPIGHVVFGSTAARLLQDSPVPVAVAPRGFSETSNRRLHRITVAYDGSAESRRALETAIELKELTHADLTVVHAVEPPRTGYGAFGQAVLAMESDGDGLPANALLQEGLRQVPAELAVKGRLFYGFAAEALAEAAKHSDLLVLGSRGRGPLMRAALGSVSGPLARQAPCPILVIPRGEMAGSLAGSMQGAAGEGR